MSWHEGYIDLNDFNPDSGISLEELAVLLGKWKKKYGDKAVLAFDAGYNNVQACIKPFNK